MLTAALSSAVLCYAKPITLTLKDAVVLAIRNNPNLKQDELTRITQKFSLVLAKNEFEPQYELTGSASYSTATSKAAAGAGGLVPVGPLKSTVYTDSVNLDPKVSLKNHYGTEFSVSMDNPYVNGFYSPSLVLTVTQPLLQGFGRPVVDAALNNAKDAELINKLNFKQSTIETVSKVIQDYLTLVGDYETLKVDEISLKNFQRTVKNDQALISAGRMAKSDIVQAQASVVGQLSTLQNDKNAIYASRNVLLDDLGLPPEVDITIPKVLNFTTIKDLMTAHATLPSMGASRQVALGNNIPYQTAIITIRTLDRSLLLALDQRRWTLDLTASETRGPDTVLSGIEGLTNGDNHSEEVGLDLTVPIDDVSSQAQVIDQRVSLENALIALKEQKRSLLTTTDTIYRTMLSSNKSLEISKEALKLQEETVYISEQKQLAGKTSTFEVLTNQRNLTTQQLQVVTNQISYLLSILAYEDQLGVTLEPWHIKLKY